MVWQQLQSALRSIYGKAATSRHLANDNVLIVDTNLAIHSLLRDELQNFHRPSRTWKVKYELSAL
jgi:hypothetical protein